MSAASQLPAHVHGPGGPGAASAAALTLAAERLVRNLDVALPLGWEAVVGRIYGLGQEFGYRKL